MAKLLYRSLILLTISCCSINLFSQVQHEKKERKYFNINSSTEIELENKYGNIIVETWERDSVLFDIHTTVYADGDGDAFDLLDRISFSGYSSGEFLRFRTLFQPHKSKIKNFFRELVKADRSNVTVNYVVFLPIDVDLKIINKFGDVYLPDYRGKFDLELSHGDLKAATIYNGDIQVSFGDVDIRHFIKGDMELKFGDLEIDRIGNVDIVSNGSDLEIESAEKLSVDVSKGSIQIREANSVSGNFSFCDLRLDILKESIDLDMRFSDLKIEKVDIDVSSIRLEQRMSDVSIDVTQLAFKLDAELKGGSFRVANLDEKFKTIESDKNVRRISGSKGEQPKAMIYINGSNSEIFFKNN